MTESKWYTRRDILVIALIAIIIVQLVVPNPVLYQSSYDKGYNDREAFEEMKWNRFITMINKEQAAYEALIESLEQRLEEATQEDDER